MSGTLVFLRYSFTNSTLYPSSVPSLSTDVSTIKSIFFFLNLVNASFNPILILDSQPLIATKLSLISIPTAIRPGFSLIALSKKTLSSKAEVPKITLLIPRDR